MKRKILLRNKKKVLQMGWERYTETFHSPLRNVRILRDDSKMAIDFGQFSGYRKRVVVCPQFYFGRTRKSSISMLKIYGYMYSRSMWELRAGIEYREGMLLSEDDVIEVFVHEKNFEVQK